MPSEPSASPSPTSPTTGPSTVRKALLIVAGGLVLLAAFTGLPITDGILSAVRSIRELGQAGAVVYGGLYVLATVLMLPATPVTLGAGLLYGQWLGSLVVALGATAGATLAFLLGRTLLRSTVERWMSARPRFRALDSAMADQGFKIVLLIRLSPVFPFNLTNYGLGLTRVSLPHYIAASFLGMLPGVFLFVYIGTTLQSISELLDGRSAGAASQALYWAGLVATVAVTTLITRAARRALDTELARTQENPDA